MATLGERNGRLYVDFRFQGMRCRETIGVPDTPANRKKVGQLVTKMEAEIVLGTFEYHRYFPNGRSGDRFIRSSKPLAAASMHTATFGQFAAAWFDEMKVQWSLSYRDTVRINLDKHLIPQFCDTPLTKIDKS